LVKLKLKLEYAEIGEDESDGLNQLNTASIYMFSS